MVFIGSRKNLRSISDDFKNAWITFIRKFNRNFRRKSAEKLELVIKDSLLKSLEILYNEVVRISRSVNLEEKKGEEEKNINENDYYQNLVSLSTILKLLKENFNEYLDDISKLAIDKKEKKVDKKEFNVNKANIILNIKKAKALITLVANSKADFQADSEVDVGRRMFFKKAGTAAAVTAGAYLSGCAAGPRFLVKIVEDQAKILQQGEFYKLIDSESVVAEGATFLNPISQLASKIVYIIIYVVHDRKVKPIMIQGDVLKKALNPALIINGYFVGFIITVDRSVNTIVLNKSLKADKLTFYKDRDKYCLTTNRAGSNPVIYFKDLVTENYNLDFFVKVHSNDKYNTFLLGNDYPKSPFFLGDPLNNKINNVIIFNDKQHYGFFVKQETFSKFKQIDLDAKLDYDNLLFLYLGNNAAGIYKIDNVEKKLHAIARGIYNVEKTFSVNMIDEVQLIDYEISNASATPEGKLRYYTGYLKTQDLRSVLNTTEHELLHLFVYRFGYSEDLQIRAAFAKFKNYTGKTHESVVKRGFLPFDDFNKDYGNKIFFSFLNEKNYFDKPSGGHSHGNIWEFTTSFIHTLMYFEMMSSNIKKHEKDEQIIILNNYKIVLDLMYLKAPVGQKKFFKKRQIELAALIKKVR